MTIINKIFLVAVLSAITSSSIAVVEYETHPNNKMLMTYSQHMHVNHVDWKPKQHRESVVKEKVKLI